MSINFNDTQKPLQGMLPWSLHHCPIPQSFGNSDELRDPMFDFHLMEPRSSGYAYMKKQIQYDEHARDHIYTFHAPPKGYATAAAVVFDTNINACIDTGSGASIMDRRLLPQGINLFGIVEDTEPVALRGVCGLQIADEIVKASVKLGGKDSVEVAIEAYLVDNLDAGLIIGLSQLEDLDAVLYLKRRIMTIQGKEVALTYQNGGGSNEISSMHMSVSKPTYVVHRERRLKWAALTDVLQPPNQANSALTKSVMLSLEAANQNQAFTGASSVQIPALISSEYNSQSEALLAATSAESSSAHGSTAHCSTTSIPAHACKRCNLVASSNRNLRRHRCSGLSQQHTGESKGQVSGAGRKRFGSHGKWIALGNTRRHAGSG